MRERGLNLVRNVARIVHAGGFGNIALAGIIKPVFGMLLHFFNYCVEHLFLAAYFIARDKAAQVIHVKQGANVHHRAKPARGLGYAPALNVKRKVGGKEPMVQAQPVCHCPVVNLVYALALVAKVGKLIHNKAVAGGRAKGVHDEYLAPGVFFAQLLCGKRCAVANAGNAA